MSTNFHYYDSYYITVVQGHNGEIVTNQYAMSAQLLKDDQEDGLADMLAHLLREMEYAMLASVGHIDRHRLWGVTYGRENDLQHRHGKVHVLDGPNAGESVYVPRWQNGLWFPAEYSPYETHPMPTAEYRLFRTVIGTVAVYQGQN